MEGVCAPFGRWVGENMCQLNIYICIGYILPTFGGYMTVRGCLCALWALGWETKKLLKKFPWCQIVRGVKLSVFTHGVKLSAVSNCPGVKLSGVKLSWCQIVRCQIVRGVKLSGVKLSWCQIVRQHGRCQIVRGVKLSWCQIVLAPLETGLCQSFWIFRQILG